MKVYIDNRRFFQIDRKDLKKVSRFNWRFTTSKRRKQSYVASHRAGYLHRFLLGVRDRRIFVDHINHDTLDNRRKNLRIVTPAQNSVNKKFVRHEKRGKRGIYRVSLSFEGNRIRVSGLKTKKDADAVRKFLIERLVF